MRDGVDVGISVTEASSPDVSIKKEWRAIHSRSNSDVTPECVCSPSPVLPRALHPRRPHPRSHSLGARPCQKRTLKPPSSNVPAQRSSATNLTVEFSPHVEIGTLSSILAKCEKNLSPKCSPRKIRSERTSPNVSVISIPDVNPLLLNVGTVLSDKSSSQLVYVPSDPWTKMTDSDLKNGGKLSRTDHFSLDYSMTDNGPWVLHDSVKENYQSRQRLYRKSRSLSRQKTGCDTKNPEPSLTFRVRDSDVLRSKLDRFPSMSCGLCWPTECRCLKPNDSHVSKTSPTFSLCDKSPDKQSFHASPSRLCAERMYGAGKMSPVFIRNQSRSSSINSKCLHNSDHFESICKMDEMCSCNNKRTFSVSPKPSPRHLSPKLNYKSLPSEDNRDVLEKSHNKDISCKVFEPEVVTPIKIDNATSETSSKPNSSSWNSGIITNKDNRSPKSIDTCDPLLETTC